MVRCEKLGRKDTYMYQTRKIGVVGQGHVGAHVANSLLMQGIADELYLCDINEAKVTSEVQDLRDSLSFVPYNTKIVNCYDHYEELACCDVIVNAAGKVALAAGNRDGELFEFNVFAATLGHSRRHIFIRSGTRTTDDLVRCMYATIARLGGVPREWVTDNMSALVTVKGGRRLKVQRAYEFAKAAGFELKLCRPRSPQTKGKVESSNRFLSRLAAYQGDFDGWDDIDEIIARIEDASNSEPNETTGLPPSALFMEEKDALLPVGNLRALEEAMGDVVRVARVPATMLVSAHGEPMSVPRRCIGRPARIVCMPGGAMDCYVGGELVATHVAGGPAYDPAHYAEAMAGKRWFGDAAGDIEAAAAANLGLLDSIGGSL